MDSSEFLDALYHEFATELAPVLRLRKFTHNAEIIGAHAEASVRSFVRRCVHPLHVSTGAIIYEGNCGPNQSMAQLDTIIWAPLIAPAVFENEGFALVPRGNAVAALEIKRSMYRSGTERMARTLRNARQLFYPNAQPQTPRMLGVYCTDGDSPPKSARRLISTGKAVCLLENSANGDYSPNSTGIKQFVNFLTRIRAMGLGMPSALQINDARTEARS